MSDIISSDIYKISDSVNQLQKRYMDNANSDTLMLGIFGYLNENLSSNLQNAVMMSAEWGNEFLPITAKFDKTILTNAILYDIQSINAIPSEIDIMIGFVEKELKAAMTAGKFTISKDCSLMIGEYEFHLDYDIIINSEEIAGEGTVYTSMYDINRNNDLSDIDSPYIDVPPIRLVQNNDTFIFVTCAARQISIEKTYKKIISNNILENKTVDFEFSSQMADFIVKVINADGSIDYIEAIYEGMPDSSNAYCYYNFLDETTIRLKFDSDSYDPSLNSTVEIDIITTTGKDGNFLYNQDCINTLDSETSSYNNLYALIKPIGAAAGGIDRKSIAELKQIIPKEILARGSIINTKDLQNFFNNIDADNRMLFYKKRDNQITRLYYAYLLAKDEDDNIIPTNTLDLLVTEKEFSACDDDRYIINPGTPIVYDGGTFAYVRKDVPNDPSKFVYTSPLITVINRNPLSISYYLDVIDSDYKLKFDYINQDSFVQFIVTTLNCKKIYIESSKYIITTTIHQNVDVDKGLVKVDKDGNIVECNIKPVLVFKVDDNNSYYVEGEIISYNSQLFSYDVQFELDSDSTLNSNNHIKIKDVFVAKGTDKADMYLPDTINTSLYIYAKFDKSYGKKDGDMIPNIDGYTLCNRYSTISGLHLFYNYSNIIKSTINVFGNKDEKDGYTFRITSVPLFRKAYIDDAVRCTNCVDYIQYRKAYIDKALTTLENSFDIDLKFFNTYGPAKSFTIGYDNKVLDKVNLTLNFRTKLKTGANEHIMDHLRASIKTYVENINTIVNFTHMTNLTTELTKTYSSEIEFIEFTGINNYDALIQYIKKDTTEIINRVPEFLCINLKDGNKPDINIITV